jgi:hypothetical protein
MSAKKIPFIRWLMLDSDNDNGGRENLWILRLSVVKIKEKERVGV